MGFQVYLDPYQTIPLQMGAEIAMLEMLDRALFPAESRDGCCLIVAHWLDLAVANFVTRASTGQSCPRATVCRGELVELASPDCWMSSAPALDLNAGQTPELQTVLTFFVNDENL